MKHARRQTQVMGHDLDRPRILALHIAGFKLAHGLDALVVQPLVAADQFFVGESDVDFVDRRFADIVRFTALGDQLAGVDIPVPVADGTTTDIDAGPGPDDDVPF